MTPTPRKRAENAYCEWYHDKSDKTLIEHIESAITSAITDQTAALQAALEELAKVKQERDQALSYLRRADQDIQRLLYERNALAKAREELINSIAKQVACEPAAPFTMPIAAHDRQVAARVLRDIQWTIPLPMGGHDLLELAAEYEAGTREVPGE